jgi:adenylate kinase family enzyme
MRRIAAIGCGGSGKTVLATRLGEKLSLPVHHLDRLFWRSGWQETPKDEWRALQEKLCAQDEWIVDGNYGGTMDIRLAAADTIIFLDIPTLTCLLGAVQRFLRFRGSSRPEMAEGCPEKLGWDYLKWICAYRRDRRPKIMARLGALASDKRVVVLDSRRAIERFLAKEAGKARQAQSPAGTPAVTHPNTTPRRPWCRKHC